MIAIRITNANKDLIAAMTGMDRLELEEKLYEAKRKYQEERALEFQKNFFKTDEEGIKKIKEKIRQIKESLPDNISNRDRMIAMYGWLEEEFEEVKNMTPPPVDDIKFTKAMLLELILMGDIDTYLRAINWD